METDYSTFFQLKFPSDFPFNYNEIIMIFLTRHYGMYTTLIKCNYILQLKWQTNTI